MYIVYICTGGGTSRQKKTKEKKHQKHEVRTRAIFHILNILYNIIILCIITYYNMYVHFLRKSDCLGCAVLLCLGCAVLLCLVCLFDLACFFLPSFSSLIKTYM